MVDISIVMLNYQRVLFRSGLLCGAVRVGSSCQIYPTRALSDMSRWDSIQWCDVGDVLHTDRRKLPGGTGILWSIDWLKGKIT